jgi:hypothetical protein
MAKTAEGIARRGLYDFHAQAKKALLRGTPEIHQPEWIQNHSSSGWFDGVHGIKTYFAGKCAVF